MSKLSEIAEIEKSVIQGDIELAKSIAESELVDVEASSEDAKLQSFTSLATGMYRTGQSTPLTGAMAVSCAIFYSLYKRSAKVEYALWACRAATTYSKMKRDARPAMISVKLIQSLDRSIQETIDFLLEASNAKQVIGIIRKDQDMLHGASEDAKACMAKIVQEDREIHYLALIGLMVTVLPKADEDGDVEGLELSMRIGERVVARHKTQDGDLLQTETRMSRAKTRLAAILPDASRRLLGEAASHAEKALQAGRACGSRGDVRGLETEAERTKARYVACGGT